MLLFLQFVIYNKLRYTLKQEMSVVLIIFYLHNNNESLHVGTIFWLLTRLIKYLKNLTHLQNVVTYFDLCYRRAKKQYKLKPVGFKNILLYIHGINTYLKIHSRWSCKWNVQIKNVWGCSNSEKRLSPRSSLHTN